LLSNFSTGQSAESLAVTFLTEESYQVLDQNVRLGNHEVDIIALDKRTEELVFIEVKSRSSGWFGGPSHAVDRHKLGSMRYVAGAYRRQHHHFGDFRFDIITVIDDTIEHYQNVTWIR